MAVVLVSLKKAVQALQMPNLATAQKSFLHTKYSKHLQMPFIGKSFQMKTSKKYIPLFLFYGLRQILAKGHIMHLKQIS